jgi:hypothetical protein
MGNLIYTYGGGRFGNQLINQINLLAANIERTEYDILNLSFIPYKNDLGRPDLPLTKIDISDEYYKNVIIMLWKNKTISKLLPEKILHRIRLQALHYIATYRDDSQSLIGGNSHVPFKIPGRQYSSIDLTKREDLVLIDERDFSILAGWNIRAWPLVYKYQNKVREIMSPGGNYANEVANWTTSLKQNHDILVGLHIRQSDYKEWRNGRYYFTSKRYNDFMENFLREYEGESIGFLISSDQQQSEDSFNGTCYTGPTHQNNIEQYIIDFVKLSYCDIILAPPSTFSTLAAFLGDITIVPLYDDVIDDGFQYLEDPLFDSLEHPEMNKAVM